MLVLYQTEINTIMLMDYTFTHLTYTETNTPRFGVVEADHFLVTASQLNLTTFYPFLLYFYFSKKESVYRKKYTLFPKCIESIVHLNI